MVIVFFINVEKGYLNSCFTMKYAALKLLRAKYGAYKKFSWKNDSRWKISCAISQDFNSKKCKIKMKQIATKILRQGKSMNATTALTLLLSLSRSSNYTITSIFKHHAK